MNQEGMTMRLARSTWKALALVALFGTAACATGSREEAADGGGPIEVTIENDLQPPTSVTVWVGEQIGTRRTLGDVGPMDTRTFTLDPGTASGTYRFMARTTQGVELVSDPITVYAGESVRWDLTGNILR
jgi:hypothetical protein